MLQVEWRWVPFVIGAETRVVHVLLRAHITVHHTRQAHKAHTYDPRKRPNKGVLLMVLNNGVS